MDFATQSEEPSVSYVVAETLLQPRQQSGTDAREPMPYHVVFQVEPTREGALIARVQAAGAELAEAPFVVPDNRPPRPTVDEIRELAKYIQEHGRTPWGG